MLDSPFVSLFVASSFRLGKHSFPLFYADADLELLENIPLKDGQLEDGKFGR